VASNFPFPPPPPPRRFGLKGANWILIVAIVLVAAALAFYLLAS